MAMGEPAVKCLPNFLEVRMKTFIKRMTLCTCSVFIVYPLITCMPIINLN